MKTKLALLLSFGLMVMGEESRADVVGLKTDSSTSPTLTSITNGSLSNTLVRIAFSTTGNSGNRLTAISFTDLNIVTGSNALTATLYEGGVSKGVTSMNIGTDGVPISLGTAVGTVGAYGLLDSKNYTLTIVADGQISGFTSTNGVVTNTVMDWFTSGSQSQNGTGGLSTYGADFTLYAAVPEPSTMILTGSALAAGAVGGFFKRRRKIALETTVS